MTLPQEQRAWAEIQAAYPSQSTVVHQFPDGSTIQKPTTYGDVDNVGRFMRNCWQANWDDDHRYPDGPHTPLPAKSESGPHYHYHALHDPQGVPRAAFFVRTEPWRNQDHWDPEVLSALGMRNAPPKPQHARQIAEWGQQNGFKLPSEINRLKRLPDIPEGCTGTVNDDGTLYHEGVRCPLHEPEGTPLEQRGIWGGDPRQAAETGGSSWTVIDGPNDPVMKARPEPRPQWEYMTGDAERVQRCDEHGKTDCPLCSKTASETLPQQLRAWNNMSHLQEASPVVHQFPDGWTIKHHNTPKAMQVVGHMMHNCWSGVPTDTQKVLGAHALHDQHDIPRVAFYWQPVPGVEPSDPARALHEPLATRNNSPDAQQTERLWQFAQANSTDPRYWQGSSGNYRPLTREDLYAMTGNYHQLPPRDGAHTPQSQDVDTQAPPDPAMQTASHIYTGEARIATDRDVSNVSGSGPQQQHADGKHDQQRNRDANGHRGRLAAGQLMYHVAPQRFRESIQQRGLMPAEPDVVGLPKGVYLFATLSEAQEWAQQFNEPVDIWQAQVEATQPDTMSSGHYSPHPILPERLQLLEQGRQAKMALFGPGPDDDPWNGYCGEYAEALLKRHPHLKVGYHYLPPSEQQESRVGHIFLHDDAKAYDAYGSHPLPYDWAHFSQDNEPGWQTIYDAQDSPSAIASAPGGWDTDQPSPEHERWVDATNPYRQAKRKLSSPSRYVIEPWTKGRFGKGLVAPDGQVHAWVENEGAPDHAGYSSLFNIPPASPKFYISPDGSYYGLSPKLETKLDPHRETIQQQQPDLKPMQGMWPHQDDQFKLGSAWSTWADNSPQEEHEPFADYLAAHNEADRDSGELDDVPDEQVERHYENWATEGKPGLSKQADWQDSGEMTLGTVKPLHGRKGSGKLADWEPAGWNEEAYSQQGDRCPMCKSPRLMRFQRPGQPDELICEECHWAGEAYEPGKMGSVQQIPSLDELAPYRNDQECYEVASQIARQWPHLKEDAGFYLHPTRGPGDHGWNVAPDGTIVDMTATQHQYNSSADEPQWEQELPPPQHPEIITPDDPHYQRYVSWTGQEQQAQQLAHQLGYHYERDPLSTCPDCAATKGERKGSSKLMSPTRNPTQTHARRELMDTHTGDSAKDNDNAHTALHTSHTAHNTSASQLMTHTALYPQQDSVGTAQDKLRTCEVDGTVWEKLDTLLPSAQRNFPRGKGRYDGTGSAGPLSGTNHVAGSPPEDSPEGDPPSSPGSPGQWWNRYGWNSYAEYNPWMQGQEPGHWTGAIDPEVLPHLKLPGDTDPYAEKAQQEMVPGQPMGVGNLIDALGGGERARQEDALFENMNQKLQMGVPEQQIYAEALPRLEAIIYRDLWQAWVDHTQTEISERAKRLEDRYGPSENINYYDIASRDARPAWGPWEPQRWRETAHRHAEEMLREELEGFKRDQSKQSSEEDSPYEDWDQPGEIQDGSWANLMQWVPTEHLTPEWDRNVHGDPQKVQALGQHLQTQGFKNPVWVDFNPDTNLAHVSEGNHRLTAAKQAGIPAVPVVVYRSGRHRPDVSMPASYQGPEVDHLGQPYVPQYMSPSHIGLPVTEPWGPPKIGHLAAETPGQLQRRAQEIEQELGPDQSQVVHQWPDGWSVREIQQYQDLHREGDLMGNCWAAWGDCHPVWDASGLQHEPETHTDLKPFVGKPIPDPWRRGEPESSGTRWLSLRDPHNLPHVSFFQYGAPGHASGYQTPGIYAPLGRHNSENVKPAYLGRLKDYARQNGVQHVEGRPLDEAWPDYLPGLDYRQSAEENWFDQEPYGHCDSCGYEGTHWYRRGDFADGDPSDHTRICSNCGAEEHSVPQPAWQQFHEPAPRIPWHQDPAKADLHVPFQKGDQVRVQTQTPGESFEGTYMRPDSNYEGSHYVMPTGGSHSQWVMGDSISALGVPGLVQHPDPWMDNEPGSVTFPQHWSSMDPPCPRCGSPMYWRDAAGLTGMHPEGAWECSNQRCWNMVPPGELAPESYEDPDSGSSGLTLPEHWGRVLQQPAEWVIGDDQPVHGLVDLFGHVDPVSGHERRGASALVWDWVHLGAPAALAGGDVERANELEARLAAPGGEALGSGVVSQRLGNGVDHLLTHSHHSKLGKGVEGQHNYQHGHVDNQESPHEAGHPRRGVSGPALDIVEREVAKPNRKANQDREQQVGNSSKRESPADAVGALSFYDSGPPARTTLPLTHEEYVGRIDGDRPGQASLTQPGARHNTGEEASTPRLALGDVAHLAPGRGYPIGGSMKSSNSAESPQNAASPVNQSFLSLNEIGRDWPMTGTKALGTPFIYDRGTQTVHVGPEGAYHGDFHRYLQGQMQGPIFLGEHDGGVIGWHTTPNNDERAAVVDLLRRNYGQPFHDPLAHGKDEFGEFELPGAGEMGQKAPRSFGARLWERLTGRLRERAPKGSLPLQDRCDPILGASDEEALEKRSTLQCPTCGDPLPQGTADCPRCDWGDWTNQSVDNMHNPQDPTIEMHRGIQASYDDLPYWQRNEEWQPGVEGKGWLGENGVYSWRIGQDRYPRHMDNKYRAEQAVGNLLRPFQIGPDGKVYDIGRGPIVDQHMQAILAADPRLHNDDVEPFTLAKTADYQGWTNWDTWHTKLMMDNDYDLYQFVQKMMDTGRWKTPEDVRDWAITHVLAPHNKQAIEDAKEWNSIPEEERIDHRFEDLKDKSPQAADIVDGLGFGPDVSDDEPTLMDPEMVNWQEIWQHLVDEQDAGQEYEREINRLQDQGLGWATNHSDEINQMRDAMYRYHGAVPEEDLKAEYGGQYAGDDPRNYFRRNVNVPLEHFKQWGGWPDNFLPGGPDTARSKLFDYRYQTARERAKAKLLERSPHLTPEQIDEMLDARGSFAPDYIKKHFPGGKYDTPFNLQDPNERGILEGDPLYQGWAQNGYPMSLSNFTSDLIGDIQGGRSNPYGSQMQEALQQRGYTPEQIQNIMRQKWRWDPETNQHVNLEPPAPKQPDPSLDQPGEEYFPSDWA